MAVRAPVWLALAGLTVALLGAAALAQGVLGGQPQPPARPPTPPDELPPPSSLDPTVTVSVPTGGKPGAGTAFSVSPGGIWLTARHVVEGCARTVIEVGPGQGVAAEVRIDPKRDDYSYGRFAWIWDPEGNRVELWQPA